MHSSPHPVAAHPRTKTTAVVRHEESSAVAEVRIAAEPRTEFGKGAARRIRRDDKVPAVLYGHGAEPRHISLPGHELMLALKTANVLLTLDIERQGRAGPAQGRPARPDQGLPRARRPRRRPPRREGHRRRRRARRRRRRARHPRVPRPPDAVASRPRPPTSRPASRSPSRASASATRSTPATCSCLRAPRSSTDPDALVVTVTAAPTAEQLEAELAEAEAEVGIAARAPSGLPRRRRGDRAPRATVARRASRGAEGDKAES